MLKNIVTVENPATFNFLHINAASEDFAVSTLVALINRVKETKNAISDGLDKIYNRGDYVPTISISFRKLGKKLDTYNYVDLSTIKIFKPIGLNSTYNVLLASIEVIQEDLLRIEERLLIPFLKWSGEILNRPEKLSRVTINQIMEFMSVDKANEMLDTSFDPNDTSDVSNFGELFESNRQFLDVLRKINKLIEKQNTLPPKVLMKKIEDASKRSEVLVRRCMVNKDDVLCSKVSKKVIADIFYNIGLEMALYGRLSYNLISTKTALEDSASKIISMR